MIVVGGLSVRACGELPAVGTAALVDGDLEERRALLHWSHDDGAGNSTTGSRS